METSMPPPAIPPPAIPTPYPTPTRTATSLINNTPTTAMSIYFSDKILITISQGGRLAQWFHTPLDPTAPANSVPHSHHEGDPEDEPPLDLLPLSHLTPTTLLGGGGTERESMGQLYAVQIATAIRMRESSEGRTVVVGLGLSSRAGAGAERDEFFEVMELVGKVL